MQDHQQEYAVKTLCRVLAVSESGYYARYCRVASWRQRENEQLTEHVRHAYQQGRHVYGSPCVHAELPVRSDHVWEAPYGALSGAKPSCSLSRSDAASAPLTATTAILWLIICCNVISRRLLDAGNGSRIAALSGR